MPKRPTEMKQRVKRIDVAQEAGVSTATVSYVLNKTKRLTSEVEKRVVDAAKKLNYIPNRSVHSLPRDTSNTLAVITADLTNLYQLDVIKGLQAEALKHDYVLTIVDAFGDVDKYVEYLISSHIVGIFVSAAPDFLSDDHLVALRDAGIKVLTDFSRSTYMPDVSYIMSDMFGGFLQVVTALQELGHEKIGYLSAFDESCYYDMRLSAYKVAISKRFSGSIPIIEYGGWPYASSEQLGSRLMTKMLKEHPDDTAVIATNDLMAIGALEAAKAAGKRVPEDISVVGVDNIALSAETDPPLTTLDQSGKEFGAKIFHVLHENITENTSGKYILPMRLIQRGSTAPAPNGKKEVQPNHADL